MPHSPDTQGPTGFPELHCPTQADRLGRAGQGRGGTGALRGRSTCSPRGTGDCRRCTARRMGRRRARWPHTGPPLSPSTLPLPPFPASMTHLSSRRCSLCTFRLWDIRRPRRSPSASDRLGIARLYLIPTPVSLVIQKGDLDILDWQQVLDLHVTPMPQRPLMQGPRAVSPTWHDAQTMAQSSKKTVLH